MLKTSLSTYKRLQIIKDKLSEKLVVIAKTMKIIFILLLTIPFSLTQVSGQNKKEVEMTYLHKIPFSKLFKAGDRQRFIQLCNTQIDSVVQGTINFDKASVAQIKDCKMSMRILVDTIRNYKVETSNSKNTKQLIATTMTVYGNPTETKTDNGQPIYIWKEPFYYQFIISTLTIDTKEKRGLLTSKIE